MSHFVSITTQIKDIDALRSACTELGLSVLENEQARGYGGALVRGEFVIRLTGPYDITATRASDGSYALATDWWDGHVEKEVGPSFGRLLQLYAVHKATKEARQRGLSVQRKLRADGSIRLTLTGA